MVDTRSASTDKASAKNALNMQLFHMVKLSLLQASVQLSMAQGSVSELQGRMNTILYLHTIQELGCWLLLSIIVDSNSQVLLTLISLLQFFLCIYKFEFLGGQTIIWYIQFTIGPTSLHSLIQIYYVSFFLSFIHSIQNW